MRVTPSWLVTVLLYWRLSSTGLLSSDLYPERPGGLVDPPTLGAATAGRGKSLVAAPRLAWYNTYLCYFG